MKYQNKERHTSISDFERAKFWKTHFLFGIRMISDCSDSAVPISTWPQLENMAGHSSCAIKA